MWCFWCTSFWDIICKFSYVRFEFYCVVKGIIFDHFTCFVFENYWWTFSFYYFNCFPFWYRTRSTAHFWNRQLCSIHSSSYGMNVCPAITFHFLCLIKINIWNLFNLWFWPSKINFVHCSITVILNLLHAHICRRLPSSVLILKQIFDDIFDVAVVVVVKTWIQ